MATLLYQGHASYRIRSGKGTIIYVDPYAGEGYGLPADIILVTHQHQDHNQTGIVAKAEGCTIITNREALVSGRYRSFTIKDIAIEAVPAYNGNHGREECVGYVMLLDGITIYAAGDTSTTEEMATLLPKYRLDYALLPIDGRYNMDPAEAAKCAEIMGAKHTIPVHMKPGTLFDRSTAERFVHRSRLIVEPGQEVDL